MLKFAAMNRKNQQFTRGYRFILVLIAVLILAGCASIGRPEGGPRDETPPVFVRSNPAPGTLNFKRSRLEVVFDENVQLDDAFNKVIVSPSQKMPPVVRAQGHRVTVELRDTLVPDMTYTIDFGDAIKDLNEGNILDGFAMEFSTGDKIDSLRVSGVLMDARTLEPAQGMLVGVYSNLADSALTTLPLERVSRTNSRGQFTIRGLKDTTYRVFAIDDMNRDYRWDRSEGVAFFDVPVRPSVQNITVNDTLRDITGNDSIVERPGIAYLPADVLLTWFKEDFAPHYLDEYSRPARNRVKVILSAPYDSVPRASVVKTPALEGVDWNDITVADITPGNDTVTWWIKDPVALTVDSLTLALTYPRTDSLENVEMYTDTLKFFYRPSNAEIKQAKEKAKLQAKGADTIPEPTVIMDVKPVTGTNHEVYLPLLFQSATPWETIDTTLIRFDMLVDSVWQPAPRSPLRPVEENAVLQRQMDFDPVPGTKYRFEADSTAFVDIYGSPSKKITHEFTVKSLDSYSTVVFNMLPADSTITVELLDTGDKVKRVARADAAGRVVFDYVAPGQYYARMYFDDNGDGEWTTGTVATAQQPEEAAYYPKKIDARANWDVDVIWDIYATPLDQQKPYAILKNRPKLKQGEEQPQQDEEMLDEWGRPIRGRNRNNMQNGFNGMPNNGFGNGNMFNGMEQLRQGNFNVRR